MAVFLNSEQINVTLIEMINNADDVLCFVSPYIKLHDRIKDAMRLKIKNGKLKIIIVFGKNEADASKSLSKEDFDFLTKFPNVKICYEKNLHAKYYTSEDMSIITSMNLHQFSQNNNIEAGILMFPKGALKKLASVVTETENLDKNAWDYFHGVIRNSEAIFEKEPVYETKMFGLHKEYTHSKITIDSSEQFFNNHSVTTNSKRVASSAQNNSFVSYNRHMGYCIRTGDPIPFDLNMPMSEKAFKTWANFGDEYYPERYCHYSGELSDGETCFARPVLKKYWNKAMK